MSYNTVAEATTYIAAHYTSLSAEYLYWTNLSAGDKQVLLTKAFTKIERLPYVGVKLLTTQTTQFPRTGQLVVAQDVKDAEVVEALASSGAFPGISGLVDMHRRGVKSYTIGHLSETFVSGGSGMFGNTMDEICSEAAELLLGYLSGGYDIC